METEIFVPLIKSSEAESEKAERDRLRSLFSTLLSIPECAKAVATFKSNGIMLGHKVLDDAAAVGAMLEKAPAELTKQAEGLKLSQYQQTQVLNQVLRRQFELDKRGKLTGQPSKRVMLQQQNADEGSPL